MAHNNINLAIFKTNSQQIRNHSLLVAFYIAIGLTNNKGIQALRISKAIPIDI